MKQCKLEIRDEVNCKITGLDLSDRKTLMKMFEFEVPGARYLPSVRLGRWNGKTSYFALGGSTYINLLPEILPLLDQAGYDIELEDTRDYQTNFTFDKVTEETFKHKLWPKGHPAAGQPVVLRDYQIEIINNYLANPQALQEIATGAGKTLITAALSYYRCNIGSGPRDAKYDAIQAAGGGELPQPTLYLHGADDGCIGSEVAESMRTFSPWATLKIVEGAGHFLQLEKPAEVNKLIIDWVTAK
jgi:pimeloyl-ACP methyl ester carboxylesterase